MATITDQELEAEFDQFGVELGDLMVIEKCKLFTCLLVDLCSKVKRKHERIYIAQISPCGVILTSCLFVLPVLIIFASC